MTDIAAVRSLSPEKAAQGLPVRLRGRVTFINDPGRLVFVQDSSTGICVDMDRPVPPLHVGEEVVVEGVSAWGDSLPTVLGADLSVVDAVTQLPTPKPITRAGIDSGMLDCQWIQVDGIQRSIVANGGGGAVIEIETSEGSVQAICIEDAQDLAPNWVGQRVHFSGVMRIVRPLQRGGARAEVWLSGWRDMKRDGAPPPAAGGRPGLPLLKSVAQVRKLSTKEVVAGYPVHLEGICTMVGSNIPGLFFQDETGGIFIRGLPKIPIAPADLLEIDGITHIGNLLADIDTSRAKVLKHSRMPEPVVTSVSELLDARHLASWIQFDATIVATQRGAGTAARRGERLLSLTFLAEGRRISGGLLCPETELDRARKWVNAFVRVQGVCASDYNQQRQFRGIFIWVPGLEYMSVLKPAPVEEPPVQSISQLLQMVPITSPGERRCIEGVVTLPPSPSTDGFYIQDKTGGCLVRARPGEPLRVGDLASATGYPAIPGLLAELVDATYRKIGDGVPVAPRPVLAEEAARGESDSRLVRIKGYLTNQVSNLRRQELTLQAGDIVYAALLDMLGAQRKIDPIRIGSLVEVTGVCSTNVDQNRIPQSFRILLRTQDDVTVLSLASWWTRGHMAEVSSLMAVLVLVTLAWIRLLRSEVRRQTEQIRSDAQTKAELIKEINHRVKNNLTAILGLLGHEKTRAKADGRPFVDEAIGNVSQRIRSLLQMHQMLSEHTWAPVRLTDLADRIVRAALSAAAPGRQVLVDVAPSPVEVSPRQASNLALVLNELVTNSIKHALPLRDPLRISILVESHPDEIALEYRDDGPGYGPEVVRWERANVGLKLIRQLVSETLRGSLSLEDKGGAVARLRIKVEEPHRT